MPAASKKSTSATSASNRVMLSIPRIKWGVITMRLIGQSPVITQNWNWKTLQMLEEDHTQTGNSAVALARAGAVVKPRNSKKDRPPKHLVQSFKGCLYPMDDEARAYVADIDTSTPEAFASKDIGTPVGRFGVKGISFKLSAIAAAVEMGWIKQKQGLMGLRILTPDSPSEGLVEIQGEMPIHERLFMRRDPVTLHSPNGKTMDLRYRAEFEPWFADLTIRYMPGMFTPEGIITMMNLAGEGIGVGEWRSERKGQYGAFAVDESNLTVDQAAA